MRLISTATVFAHDMAMIPIAWFGAYWLRFNLGVIPDFEAGWAIAHFPYVIVIQTLFFCALGLYRGVWRFASLPDLMRIVKSVVGGVFVIAVCLFFANRLVGVPRSALPLYAVILTMALCGPRFLYRFWKDTRYSVREGPKSIIIGAGMAGEMLVRDLFRDANSQYMPIGFVDDDRGKFKREIHGLRVLGACKDLPELVQREGAEVLLIAIPSATNVQMRAIVEICESCNVPFLTLPSVSETLSSHLAHRELRDVSIEDLLGRAPVRLDWQPIRLRLEQKTVLVTGGGGSIGSELCKQIAALPIDRLVILEQSEFNLYQVEAELLGRNAELNLHAVLGDVTNESTVHRLIAKFRPDIIFHAAAYKHVPLLEARVVEAARNNILGTKIVAEAALRHRVNEFVLISTDKAVNPTNVMGASKRAAEILCQNFDRSGETHFITVRFGNVLDSAGSVVPLFRQQIRKGGPLTVTDPEITRFFMTIPEACQLILAAAAIGKGGEIFVLDMGEPIKIRYLAEQMIRLSGKRPDRDIKIEYIGLRPGEKLHEELFHDQEQLIKTAHSKLFLAQSREFDRSDTDRRIMELQQACEHFDEPYVLRLLQELIPEFSRIETPHDNLVYLDEVRKKSGLH